MSGYYYTPDGEKHVEITPEQMERLKEWIDETEAPVQGAGETPGAAEAPQWKPAPWADMDVKFDIDDLAAAGINNDGYVKYCAPGGVAIPVERETVERLAREAGAAFQRITSALMPTIAALIDALEPVFTALGVAVSYAMEEVLELMKKMADAADEIPPDDEDPPLRPVICLIWIYHAERLVELRKLYGQGIDEGPGRRPSQAQAAPCVYEGLRRPKQ